MVDARGDSAKHGKDKDFLTSLNNKAFGKDGS
jgi:hypothetical protein